MMSDHLVRMGLISQMKLFTLAECTAPLICLCSISFLNRSMGIITAENAIYDGRVPMCGVFRAPTR